MDQARVSTQQLELRKDNAIRLWGLVTCFVVCLLFVLFQGGKLAYMLFAIVTILSVYLMLGRWSGIASVKGSRVIQTKGGINGLSAGSSIPVQMSLHIPGFWPLPYVIVKEEIISHQGDKHAFEVTFVPDYKRNGVVTYYTPPLRRGAYRFAPTICITEDIFGMFRHYGLLQMDESFMVLPQTVKIKEWNLLVHLTRGAHHHTVSSKAMRETTQINGVREYVYGDRISRIHWNATARTGTWKSKEFERETLPRTMIVLDMERQAYPTEASFELAVSAAASIFQFGAQRELPLGLLSTGQETSWIETGKGSRHLMRIMEHLVTVEADGKIPLEQVMIKRLDRFVQGSFIILISPRNGKEMNDLTRLMRIRQLNCCHIWIRKPQSQNGGVEEASRISNSGEYTIYPITHLQELPVVLGGRNV